LSSTTPAQGRRTRVLWGLLDEGLSSVTNVLVTVLAARALSSQGFGEFAIVSASTAVVIALVRGAASDTLASAHSADPPEQQRAAVRSGAVTALTTGLVVGAPALALAPLLGGRDQADLLLLLPFLLGLVLQDYLRFAFFVLGRARDAFVNDAFWFVVQVPLLVIASANGAGALGLLAVWSGSGALAAVVGLLQLRALPASPAATRPWLRRHRGLWPYLLLDNSLGQASNVGALLVLSLTTTLAEIGAFRVALTVYAPLLVLSRGLIGVAVPEVARVSDDRRGVRRTALLIGLVQLPVAALFAVGLLLLPDSVGRGLFGDTWSLAEPLLGVMVVPIAAVMLANGVAIGLRGLAAGRAGLTARIAVTVLSTVSAAIGAYVDGAHGALVAWAIVAPVQVAIWWWLLVVATCPAEVTDRSVTPARD
jgi:O-antigen/teichoic acid export membrane protein